MKYRFGPFEFDPGERRLLRSGEEIHLQPKTFEMLALLLEHRGHLVAKDELMSRLWPDQVVTEYSLTRCIREVRKALGDNAAHSRYIETVPKVGYRFVAEVTEVAESAEPDGGGAETSGIHRIGHGWLWAAGGALLVVTAWLWWTDSSETSAELPVLAILPFENRIDDPDNDLVMRGLAQEVRERLASSGELVIISGESAAAIAETDYDHSKWPEALDADWLLSGISVEDEKHRSIVIRLESAEDGLAWEENVHIISGDLIGLAENVANLVADSLGFDLPTQPRYLATAASVDSITAQQRYLLARGLIAQRNSANMARAIQLLHEVLELKPDHAGAMAALGIAYILSPEPYYPAGVALERADRLFDEALRINPESALAWAGKALSEIVQDGNLETLQTYIERALELNPYDAEVLGWAANLAGSEGRISDAFQYFSRALRIDPLHTSVIGNLSFNLARQGRYDQARDLLENARARLGNHPRLYYFEVSLALNIGDLRHALEQAQEAVLGGPQGLFFAGQLARVYARLWMRDEAESWISHAAELPGPEEQRTGAALTVHGNFGDEERLNALMAQLFAHPEYDDSNPEKSGRWLLEQLIEGHGRLLDCEQVIELAGYRISDPDSLQGTRGNVASIAQTAHWLAFCLQREGMYEEANPWLVRISSQIDFMKANGLGDSTPDMYVEAMNRLLLGQPEAALDVLEAMVEIGWLDQGALQHDPRWLTLRDDHRFKGLVRNVVEQTTDIRNQIIDDGLVSEFKKAQAEARDRAPQADPE